MHFTDKSNFRKLDEHLAHKDVFVNNKRIAKKKTWEF